MSSSSGGTLLARVGQGLAVLVFVAVFVSFVGLPVGDIVGSVDPLAVVGLVALALAVVAVSSAVEIVEAYEKEALTVFGEYRRLLEPGIHLVPPFVSRTYPFDMRTQTIDVPQQEAITRDNSPVTADAVVYIRVMDAKRAFLEVEEYERAVSNLAQTTLRAVLGDMELDDTLSRRAMINARIREELDEPTDEWGIRVESVEVREVNPAAGVRNAMEQQTSAERRRRAMILEAQGERRSAIEQAQGEKQSDIRGNPGPAGVGYVVVTSDGIVAEGGERVGRYGKHLSSSDVSEMHGAANGHDSLDSLDFDAETRELIGLDDIEAILGEIDEEAQVDIDAISESE
ncbi:phosphoesterase [Halobacteriales archaeon QH_1_68_42]|nr:MAG: phosphoesterase [Halobacteriales archaeon QH_1_68_42]